MNIPPPLRAGRRGALALALALAAACDRAPTPAAGADGAPALETLVCRAHVARGSVTCGPAAPAAEPGGPRFDQRIIGGQGRLVRLASGNPAYFGEVFAFDLTVQNLAGLPMGTADGAARDDGGVRVFFHDELVVTGGTGSVSVANPTGWGTFTAAVQGYFQYGGRVDGADRGELGADGILSPGETSAPKRWSLSVPSTVESFTFTLFVAARVPPGTLETAAPQVTGIAPATLVPGATATLTGYNFAATPASNAVTIGGAAAAVTGGSATQLQVTVPCVLSGAVAVQVSARGMTGAAVAHPLKAPTRTLSAGQAVLVTTPAEVACNEISGSGESRYVVAVYNAGTTPTASASFRLAGAQAGGAEAEGVPPGRSLSPLPGAAAGGLDAALLTARERAAEARHLELLEKNRDAYARLLRRFGRNGQPPARRAAAAAEPPPTRAIRVPDRNAPSLCAEYYAVQATRVYHAGRIAIYEDDATPAALKAANNAAMRDYYRRLGDQYNADLEPVIRAYFGDPLRRDAVTDGNGVLVALATPLFDTEFEGVAGFVASCDQFPNDEGSPDPVNAASNFGEYVYFRLPSSTAAGYAGDTPHRWYHTSRSVLVHEAKHVASLAARVANGSPGFEQSWLEEGTARHAEELWARSAVYHVGWKANTGYGSATQPGGLYCDSRPADAGCLASDPRRPARTMSPHFSTLYAFLRNPAAYSPFGRSPSDTFTFYGVSWSLARYAADRYAADEAAFFTALTQSTTAGAANLAARAGVPLDQLLGGWVLALYADDYPGLAAPDAAIRLPTWNLASIFAGLHADNAAAYPRPYPAAGWSVGFGAFTGAPTAVVGGGVSYVEISGRQAAPQLLRLEGAAGGAPPASLRIAIARLR